MMLKKWNDLPEEMRIDEVRPYYEALRKKRVALFFKRAFDVVVSLIMLVVLSPVFLILAIAIKLDSKGPVFYRQTRITQYGKKFKIFKLVHENYPSFVQDLILFKPRRASQVALVVNNPPVNARD